MKQPLHALFLPLMLLASASASAQSKAPFNFDKGFRADMVTQTQGMTIESTIYYMKDKLRTESLMMGQKTVMIMRLDKNTALMLMPSMNSYMEMPIPEQAKTSALFDNPDVTWEKIGDETLDGKATEKWKGTIKSGDQTTDVLYWIDKGDKHILQLQAGPAIVKYKNFQSGPQDAALFELPAGFTKMAMPGLPGQ